MSLEFYLVLKNVNGVSRKFQGCLKFQSVSRMFQECFKVVSIVFQGSFREISRVFQERFKGVQVRLKDVSSSIKGV